MNFLPTGGDFSVNIWSQVHIGVTKLFINYKHDPLTFYNQKLYLMKHKEYIFFLNVMIHTVNILHYLMHSSIHKDENMYKLAHIILFFFLKNEL